jgi:hypothetical protein
MKRDETRLAVDENITIQPDRLEIRLAPSPHTKPIHGDKHAVLLCSPELRTKRPDYLNVMSPLAFAPN